MTGRLLYDPDCGFCTAAAKRMQGWRLRCSIEPMNPVLLAQLGVSETRAQREIPFVAPDGTTCFGARAIGRALATGPLGWRLAGRLISHPPVLWMAEPVYRWVAAHRHELPGGTAACEMPPR